MKNFHAITFYLFAFLIVGSNHTVGAQNTVQVYTKTISKNLNYKPGEVLEIAAEKADINISGWNRDYISVEVKLISKHARREIAKKELDYLKFNASYETDRHILKNHFLADDNFRKVRGRLLIHYQIRMPTNAPVVVNNLYGKVTVEGLKNTLNFRTRFVELHIKNCEGESTVESFFGNVLIDESSGNLTCNLKKADMELSGFDGDVKIEGNYGEIHIESEKLASLTLNGNRTRVNMLTANLQSYNYDLYTSFSEIKLPETVINDVDRQKETFKKIFQPKNPLITIHTTYSPIDIKLQYNASSK